MPTESSLFPSCDGVTAAEADRTNPVKIDQVSLCVVVHSGIHMSAYVMILGGG